LPTTGVQICPAERAAGGERGDSLAALGAESGMHETRMARVALAPINEIADPAKNAPATTGRPSA
jgi:hypothetical protein